MYFIVCISFYVFHFQVQLNPTPADFKGLTIFNCHKQNLFSRNKENRLVGLRIGIHYRQNSVKSVSVGAGLNYNTLFHECINVIGGIRSEIFSSFKNSLSFRCIFLFSIK